MEQIKYLWDRYQKEVLAFVVVIAIILTAGGIYYFMQKEQPSSTIGNIVLEESSLEIKQEEETVEQVVEEETINVQVDIKGEVKNPGVYVTTPSSRVIDIINSAGGLTKNADTSLNNLSRKVEDEMVIIIYSKEEVKEFEKIKEIQHETFEKIEEVETKTEIENNASLREEDVLTNQDSVQETVSKEETNQEELNKISLNTAIKEELMTLPGIGESKANAIILYREEHGNFEKIEDIMEVSGIGQSVFEKIKDFITI